MSTALQPQSRLLYNIPSMQYATPLNANNGSVRIEPTPRAHALCPVCQQRVIAHCGKIRIWHWAHQKNCQCSDQWWENETDWHRHWKEEFPENWREVVLQDEATGEIHRADVKLQNSGLVLEFQHSAIDPQEFQSRVNIYRNMVWVADARPSQFKRFMKRLIGGEGHFDLISGDEAKLDRRIKDVLHRVAVENFELYVVQYLEEIFPKAWLSSSVPVIFDFASEQEASLECASTAVNQLQGCYYASGSSPVISEDSQKGITKRLWCLLPDEFGRPRCVCAFHRKDFVASLLTNGYWIRPQTPQEKDACQKILDEELRAMKARKKWLERRQSILEQELTMGYIRTPITRRRY